MRTNLEQEDVELIAQRVVEMIKPLLSSKQVAEDVIFSLEELAEYLRVKPKWIYDHVYELPHFKLDGLLRFRKVDIDQTVDKLALRVRAKKPAAAVSQPQL